jgi:hypothetical protein
MPLLSAATEFWGPCAWKLMHSVAATYRPQHQSVPNARTIKEDSDSAKLHYATFYKNLQYVLPCHLCRAHYSEFLGAHPVEDSLRDENTLQKWVYDLHDDVNRRNGKQSPTFDEVLRMYNEFDPSRPFTEATLADPHFGTKSDARADAGVGLANNAAFHVVAAAILTSIFFVYCVPVIRRTWVHPPKGAARR